MITRRSLIKGITALPFAHHAMGQKENSEKPYKAHQSFATEAECGSCDGPPVAKPILNVIFHGLFIFVAREAGSEKGYVEVLTPRVQEHVYGCGNWYEEYRLRETTYALSMPERRNPPKSLPGCNQGCTDRIVIPNSELADVDPEGGTFCTLLLPFPDSVVPLAPYRAGDCSKDIAQGRARTDSLGEILFRGKDCRYVKQITNLGSAHLFRYEFDSLDSTQLGLSNFYWKPKCNDLFAYNLHLFATSTFEFETPNEAASHSTHAFQKAVDLLPELDLHVRRDHHVCLEGQHCQPGIHAKEQGTLRACRPCPGRFSPPAICDAPSMFVV